MATLLATLLFQTETDFDVLIVNTDPQYPDRPVAYLEEPPVHRFIDTLRGQGHDVNVERTSVVGRSEVAAVNLILSTAAASGYELVFKVDDDHVMPPDTLERLSKTVIELESSDSPVLASGVTPWMHEVFEGASSPYNSPVESGPPTERFTGTWLEGDALKMEVGHFNQFVSEGLKYSELGSAANFMMRPDPRILWSDVGESSLFADAVWFLQLRELLKYRFVFDLRLDVWHVAAPSGGVRDSEGVHEKNSKWDDVRRNQLRTLLRKFQGRSLGVADGTSITGN